MEDKKPWYASSGVWGSLIAMGAGVAGIWGYSISEADQAQLVTAITAIAGSIGGVIALVGRLRASKKVGK